MNLLEDQWIPVKTRQGEEKFIAAYEIVQADIISLNTPRADFNAALMQFLIGLIQTVYAPDDEVDWEDLYEEPPTESQLKESFEKIKDAFYLDGDGYRFMQDRLAKDVGKYRPIEEMVFGAPGESGKENYKDLFTKKDDISGLCFSCSASALLTANFFAEDGGQSYFPTMRGNGFVSNLVMLDEINTDISLWKNIWLNIFSNIKNSDKNLKDNFFWFKDLPDKVKVEELKKIASDVDKLKSEKKKLKIKDQKEEIEKKIKELDKEKKKVQVDLDNMDNEKMICPDDSNYLQVYWAWMRRFILDSENINSNGECSICHNNSKLIKNFYRKNSGYKYPKEHWQNVHPFSPSEKYQRKNYTENNIKYKDKMLSLEMTKNGLPYTYWHNFLLLSENNAPAKNVTQYIARKLIKDQLVIYAYGYAMDSNSPLAWYESKTPLYLIENPETRRAFEAEIDKYVASSKIADSYLTDSIKFAWFDENKEKNKDRKKGFNDEKSTEISKSFFSETEAKFYETLKNLYQLAEQDKLSDDAKLKFREEWYRHVKQETINLFNDWAFKSSIQTNPRRISKAYNYLMKHLKGDDLKKILGLPTENNND